jgi:hypothetical protein
MSQSILQVVMHVNHPDDADVERAVEAKLRDIDFDGAWH